MAGSFSIRAGLIISKSLEGITIHQTGIATGIALIFLGGAWIRSGLRLRIRTS